MSRIASGVVVLPLVCSSLFASSLAAQTIAVRAEENFRAEPNGAVLAVLNPGASLPLLQRRDRWVEGALEGWVWARSLQVTTRGGFDLVVAVEGGENLRAEPSGAVHARLIQGTLLEELERRPGWIRVRRRGWLWEASAADTGRPPSEGGAPAPASVLGVTRWGGRRRTPTSR